MALTQKTSGVCKGVGGGGDLGSHSVQILTVQRPKQKPRDARCLSKDTQKKGGKFRMRTQSPHPGAPAFSTKHSHPRGVRRAWSQLQLHH